METPYDWVTIAIFAGLIVIFLQRSVGEGEPQDSIWSYLPPSIGCAVSNWFGNEAWENGSALYHAIAVLGIVAVLVYSYVVLKPFQRFG